MLSHPCSAAENRTCCDVDVSQYTTGLVRQFGDFIMELLGSFLTCDQLLVLADLFSAVSGFFKDISSKLLSKTLDFQN